LQDVDVFQALMGAGIIPPHAPGQHVGSSGQPQGDIQRAAASSTERDLLRLLDMPEDTPVLRQEARKDAPPAADAAQSPPALPDISRALAQQVSRTMSETLDTTSDTNTDDGTAEIDLEKLAEQVYRALRNRLRMERERRDK
jgi:hypothetical protein